MDLWHLYEWIDIILIFSCVFLLLSDYFRNNALKKIPPGPWSLPIIEHRHIDHKKIHLQFLKVNIPAATCPLKYGIVSYFKVK